MGSRFLRIASSCALFAALLFAAPALVPAQDMPDPSQIHGRAIPAPELPSGTVTVRLVREAIGNNIAGEQVRITVGGTTRTATTDAQGRAEFRDLPQGADARATAAVDGEALESQPFAVPTSGGLRVILIAGIARAAERKAQEEKEAAAAPAVRGVVVLGGNSRVLMQFNDDMLQVFYLLDIVNNARTRVDIGGPIIIDLPTGAAGASKLEGTPDSVVVSGSRVTILGPFAPGTTSVQVAFRLRYSSSDVNINQTWPVALQQVTVGVEKLGTLGMSSPQFATVNDVRTNDGTVFVLGSGPTLQAGGTLAVTLSGLPVHSRVPRYAALGLAGAIVLFGVWLVMKGRGKSEEEHQALVHRRDALLSELQQLELKHRGGAVTPERYAARRQRLVTELEQVYGALDEVSPRGGGEGVAA